MACLRLIWLIVPEKGRGELRKNDRLLEELLELRAFKEAHEGKAINLKEEIGK